MKLGKIAHKLDCKLRVPDDLEITGVAGIEEAQKSPLSPILNTYPIFIRLRLELLSSHLICPRYLMLF